MDYADNLYRAEVRRWVDGDTIELLVDLGLDTHHRGKFRLARVDAPETALRRGVTPEEKARGLALKAALAERWPKGTPGVVQITERGKYGRWVVELVIDQVNVSDYLLEEGLAEGF